ncbi:hypothetical protein ACPYO6_16600 [Georgenia sp. Z1344]|uniref:hypothetical protein n=1 Tax=Georgenia sp. Z1344 TaxID=3416706 RepID=UPI003CE79692
MHDSGSTPMPSDPTPSPAVNAWTIDTDALSYYVAASAARTMVSPGRTDGYGIAIATSFMTPPLVVLVDDPVTQAAEAVTRANWDTDEDDEEWEVVVIEEWDWDDDEDDLDE